MTQNQAPPGPSFRPASGSFAGRPQVLLAGFILLVFCTGTAEFLVAGLLPEVSADLDVSLPVAGQAATAYALTVAFGGPLVTLATARLPRKGLVLGLCGVFVFGTLLSALAPGFAVLLVGRVLAASAQATLFAIALVVATSVVSPDRAGRAVAAVTSGLTVATVLGVPLGQWVGGATHWRVPFLAAAAAAVLGTLLVAVSMPRAATAPAEGALAELSVLRRTPVLLSLATTAVGCAGVGVVFTYLVPLLTDVSGFTGGAVTALLVAYGVGGFTGNVVAGRLADRSVGATLRGVFTAMVAVMALLPFAAPVPWAAVLAVGALGVLSTATIAPLQTLLLRHASGAPTLSVAVNVGAFNLANALGASLGGLGVGVGLLRWNGLLGAVFAGVGLLLAGAVLRRTRS
ncbi:MFS transporter [Actinocorallia sp. A-T 12471]|uniref:MFS transporter n=1 Tax=Actinocorallia sp. A-T 12471 TaxID=3089813 RepID=UPI0029CD2AFD|nr:MFS transporter [Actinocorallia sp. A-T 12471]MDX6739376.1 MFS transporter [Actinocorallia sp. A-T 12471]